MQALLTTCVLALALVPLLTWAAPTPGHSVCGYTDRIQATTCGYEEQTGSPSVNFSDVCGLTFLTRQSLLKWSRNLNDSMTKATPVAEQDLIDRMQVDPKLPSHADTKVDSLVDGLALYQLEMFCVGEALDTLPEFQGTSHQQSLCPLLTHGRLLACNLGDQLGLVAGGDWLQERAQCSHTPWPLLLKDENWSFLANPYSVAVVRRYRQFLASWDTACPSA